MRSVAFRLLVVAPAVSCLVMVGVLAVMAFAAMGRSQTLNHDCDQAANALIREVDGPDGDYQGGAGWSMGGSFWEPSCTYSYEDQSGEIRLRWGLFAENRRL
ncbi:hypothetical protein [Solicola sp. PLA-1-18]|uniref:hypothetical protein n=1 Tax=Solicola sp. PLA-1-18 TaxID=3380532 RepID=UPI003B806940